MPIFKNPAPVIVGLVFNERDEILTVTRTIKPLGEALPGGYQVKGEDWRTALQRELWEEAYVRVSANPSDMPLFDMQTTPSTEQNLTFAVIRPRGLLEVATYKPTKETSARAFRKIGKDNIPRLCFPLHEAAIRKYLAGVPVEMRGICGYSDIW
jgi:ADP-ribose pyrophosphatase YjhB (NUDIX family)